MTDYILTTILLLPILVVSLTVHEYAHAFIAYKLGDLTAKMRGRMTINPLAHIDPIGFLLLISPLRFGWSKPVPINEYNFSRPVRDTALVAFAGPLSNIILALIFAFIMNQIPVDTLVYSVLFIAVMINFSLAIFNLTPIPPLDGHRIIRAILPEDIRYYWENLEKYSGIFIAIIFLTPIGSLITAGIGIVLDWAMRIVVY